MIIAALIGAIRRRLTVQITKIISIKWRFFTGLPYEAAVTIVRYRSIEMVVRVKIDRKINAPKTHKNMQIGNRMNTF